MLTEERLVAFLATSDAARARAFYEGVLGLTFIIGDEHLMFLDSGPARIGLQISHKPVTPPFGTAAGWNVRDLRASMRQLVERGVVFDKSGSNVDDQGVWSPVPGQGVAWFFDPDGNRLSLNGPA
jgi:catechol 2,3-dioxygenase-like lactoylglutathione lyase family enzyme